MNVKKITFILFTGLSLAFASCHSSQQLMEPKLSLKQIDDRPVEMINDVPVISTRPSFKLQYKEKPSSIQQKYATLLGVVPQTIKNVALYSFIEDWYGVRYRLGGDSKKGIDCSAFVKRLYENVFWVDLVRTACEQFNMCKYITKMDSVKEGDLVFFKTKGSRISHVGIYLMNDFFVHASSSRGVMISSLNDSYWERRYAGAGAIFKGEMKL